MLVMLSAPHQIALSLANIRTHTHSAAMHRHPHARIHAHPAARRQHEPTEEGEEERIIDDMLS